jgi:predicted dehydrogenase
LEKRPRASVQFWFSPASPITGFEVHAWFARSLRGEGENPCGADDALHAMRVLDAASRSAGTGESVAMPPRR